MPHYIKCPRCDLNYIDADKQEYCDVCYKEMKGIPTDIDELELEEADELASEICPICGENMIRAGEKMCEECRKKTDYDEPEDSDSEEDDGWREYLDDNELDSEMDELDEEFGGEFEDEAEPEEEEEYVHEEEEEDMEYVTGDEIYTLGGDDDDDEDDDDEDF